MRCPRPTGIAYWDYSNAILTLAHEAIHLGGMVGVRFGNGVVGGDPASEAKANCYGMQAMSSVAEQLGASSDDAQAIAIFYWDLIYPDYKGTPVRATTGRPTAAPAARWTFGPRVRRPGRDSAGLVLAAPGVGAEPSVERERRRAELRHDEPAPALVQLVPDPRRIALELAERVAGRRPDEEHVAVPCRSRSPRS